MITLISLHRWTKTAHACSSCSSTVTVGPGAKKTDTHNLHCPKYNHRNGVSCKEHRESPWSQVELIQSVLFCVNIIHTVWVHWFDYSPWSHSHKLKMTTWLCRTQTHHDGKSKITVYVASSFLSTASSETWSPVVGIILILLVRVFVCNYVLILPQVGVLCKTLCSTVHPHTFEHGDVTWENRHFWLT